MPARKKSARDQVVRGPQLDRAETSAVLSQAVHRVLDRVGILGGFTLQDVAEEAGVNRGLVYHYFGSRRKLLRTALRDGMTVRLAQFEVEKPLRPSERWGDYVRRVVAEARALRLGVLLFLDGDDHVQLMPLKQKSVPRLTADQEEGLAATDFDPRAALTAVTAFGYGYSVLREGFARELGMSVDELDDITEVVFQKFVQALDPQEESEQ